MSASYPSYPDVSRLAAVIFDVDGTLADNEQYGHRVAFNRAFADAGLDWYWDTQRYNELLQVTGGKERLRYYLAQDRPEQLQQPTIDATINALHHAKTQYYLDLLQTGSIPLRPGVQRLITELHQAGIRLAIATTTSRINVTTLLHTHLGAASLDWFEVIAAGDDIPAKKPAPDLYLHALQALNLPAAACLAIEDSNNGLRSAQAAGLAVIVVTTDDTCHHDFTGALAVLDDFGAPGTPASVRSGSAPASGYLDVQSLKVWHQLLSSR